MSYGHIGYGQDWGDIDWGNVTYDDLPPGLKEELPGIWGSGMPCVNDNSCPNDEICYEGKCILPACDTTADCLGNTVCIYGQCQQAHCYSNAECYEGQNCINNLCVDDPEYVQRFVCDGNSVPVPVNGGSECVQCPPNSHAELWGGEWLCLCDTGYADWDPDRGCVPQGSMCPAHSVYNEDRASGEWWCECESGYENYNSSTGCTKKSVAPVPPQPIIPPTPGPGPIPDKTIPPKPKPVVVKAGFDWRVAALLAGGVAVVGGAIYLKKRKKGKTTPSVASF